MTINKIIEVLWTPLLVTAGVVLGYMAAKSICVDDVDGVDGEHFEKDLHLYGIASEYTPDTAKLSARGVNWWC